MISLWLILAVSACSSVRPMVKIGLIAPFEGLYRETGYAALGAVRHAIEDCAPEGTAVLPLALDDSAQPDGAQRALEKMLADPAVIAIVGPFSLDTAAAAARVLGENHPLWTVPLAIDSAGNFVSLLSDLAWLTDFTFQVARMAESQGATRLLVAGLPEDWQMPVESGLTRLDPDTDIRFVSPSEYDFGQMQASDAFLWLGEPHIGAKIETKIHAVQPSVTFWMGPQGDDPVFMARYSAAGPVYWTSWVAAQYNSDSQRSLPGDQFSFLTYAATCHALGAALTETAIDAQPLRLQAFRMKRNGESEPIID